MGILEVYLDLLSKHGSRDRIMRLLAYTCTLLSSQLPQGVKLAQRLALFGGAVNGTRAFTRFLDDIPMLTATLSYGLGKQTGDPLLIRILQVLENLSNQLFFPCEHMVQFAKYEIFTVKHREIWVIMSVAMWASALFNGIIKNTLKLVLMNKKQALLSKSSHNADSENDDKIQKELSELLQKRKLVILTLAKSCFDFLNAIHFLPAGKVLWSGRLTPGQSALAGFIASVIGLHITLVTR